MNDARDRAERLVRSPVQLGELALAFDETAAATVDDAWAMAAQLHLGDLEEDGTPLLAHVRRVAATVPVEARAVAWLHEALERTGVSEEDLLLAGLTSEQLRALRLLNLGNLWQSDRAYLGHLELIARSAGKSGRLARIVKIADLRDRWRVSPGSRQRLVTAVRPSTATAHRGGPARRRRRGSGLESSAHHHRPERNQRRHPVVAPNRPRRARTGYRIGE